MGHQRRITAPSTSDPSSLAVTAHMPRDVADECVNNVLRRPPPTCQILACGGGGQIAYAQSRFRLVFFSHGSVSQTTMADRKARIQEW